MEGILEYSEAELNACKADWQTVVNLMGEIMNVPAGLVMRFAQGEIEVFVRSDSQANPYQLEEKEKLEGSGLYCETVIKQQRLLCVPNALADPDWESNPDIKLNMISYLGLPINNPDGSAFGTICVLDNKENSYSEVYISLLESFRSVIERFLVILDHNRVMKDLSERDPLTGLYNRRAFSRLAANELSRCARYEQSSVLLMIDIDGFKEINDSLGHEAGDETLQLVAAMLTEAVRKHDIVARLGGDEFLILLTDNSLAGAFDKADQLRHTIEESEAAGTGILVAVSIGMSEISPKTTLEDAMKRADRQLLLAKRNGRNRVEPQV